MIDFCLIKIPINEPETNYQYLQLGWASKSNCQQRAGRTGRVMDGRVYRMVPKSFYDVSVIFIRISCEVNFLSVEYIFYKVYVYI